MAFATVLGVAGGVYIYKPYFVPMHNPGQQSQDAPETQTPSEDKKNSPGPVSPGQTKASGTVSETGALSEPESKA